MTARVVPIYKKGDIDDPSNYRPISLLNSTYKIFVSLVRTRIQKAVDSKLSETQFGFPPNRSTSHAKTRLGVSNHFINIVKALYQSRSFFIQDQYGASVSKTQNTGIRQGCPLSPCLFLLVMTCVDEDVRSRCSGHITASRIPGVQLDAVYYAEHTILFSTTPVSMDSLNTWKSVLVTMVFESTEPSATLYL